MAHLHYDTDCFVVSGIAAREDSRFLLLFTNELGLLRAFAQGLRRERSKLRFSLQDFSRSRVSLVRGRDIWRVTGAVLIDDLGRLRRKQAAAQAAARFLKLLDRLSHGEEKNEELFTAVASAILFLADEDLSEEELRTTEELTVLRILAHLGYRSAAGVFQEFIEAPAVERAALAEFGKHRSTVVSEINTLLHATQL